MRAAISITLTGLLLSCAPAHPEETDRFQGREALREGLAFIFSLEFVMAGTSLTNEYADVTFLSPDVALIRSKLVRAGQQLSSGTAMGNRHINHLRVLQRREGRWPIVSHMISQAQEKR